MSFSPEGQESATERDEPSPQAQLPSDLLESSPEIGSSSPTVIDTVVPARQPTTTAQPMVGASPAATTQTPRHHDVIMERNDQFVDETWTLMSGRSSRTTGQHTGASQVVPYTPGPTRPALSSTPGQMLAQPRSSEQRQIEQPHFLPPGHGRTAQQRAAVENFNAAVAARARERAEAEADRARQGYPATLPVQTDNKEIGTNHNNQSQASGPGEYQNRRAEVGGIASSAASTTTLQAPMQMPMLTDPPIPLEPGQSIPLQMAFDTAHPLHAAVNSLGQPANHTDTRPRAHEGDSIFSDMMNGLIANGRAWPSTYRQVLFPVQRRVPYGREFLYYGEMINDGHGLFPRARAPRGDPIAIRNARDGEIAGWQESGADPGSRIHLLPTPNPGRWRGGARGRSDNHSGGRR